MNNLVTVPAISPQEFCGEGWRILEEKPETKALTSWDPKSILETHKEHDTCTMYGSKDPTVKHSNWVQLGFRHLVFHQQHPDTIRGFLERFVGADFAGTIMIDPHGHQGVLRLCLLGGNVLWRFRRFCNAA